MCPWLGIRKEVHGSPIMQEAIWRVIEQQLNQVQVIDFTGSGEPLLHNSLASWVATAKSAGCTVGFLTNGLLLTPKQSDRFIEAGLDWIGFSVDAADRSTYESIRRGSDFDKICSHIGYFTGKRKRTETLTMINFVVMQSNLHQLEAIVALADNLGVDQVNFKQCDVIRDQYGAGKGLFEGDESKTTRRLEKQLTHARRLAKRRAIKTTAFRFTPLEQPVCDQDPRNALFIRYDGVVAPCINLAYGGPSQFLGTKVTLPDIHYGMLKEQKIETIWEHKLSLKYRAAFQARSHVYDEYLLKTDLGRDVIAFKRSLEEARNAMPPPPPGCSHCHYLYGI